MKGNCILQSVDKNVAINKTYLKSARYYEDKSNM